MIGAPGVAFSTPRDAPTRHPHTPPETQFEQIKRTRTIRRRATVRALSLRPAGRRRTWCHVVACPFCQGHHLHRGGPDGGERVAGCGRGIYVISGVHG